MWLVAYTLALGSAGPAGAAAKTSSADATSGGGGAEANAQMETVQDRGPDTRGVPRRRSRGSLSCERYNSLWFSGTPVGTGNGAPAKSVEESRIPLAEKLEPGDFYGLVCTDENGQEVVNEIRRYNPADPTSPMDPEVLAEEAAARLAVSPPQVELSPKPGLNQIVQLTTWMWVTNWEPNAASASLPGVTATVTATPRKVTWNMGNGDQVVCKGPGTPFDFSRPEESQATDCSYTYRHSSTSQPGGVYQVSATMSYDVSWSAEGAPGGGVLPAIESAPETFPVRVIEIHAVEGVGTGAP